MKNKNTRMTRERKRTLFYICLMAFPILQFLIFYVYVNFNTIILAFQKYSYAEGASGYIIKFAGIENFRSVIKMLLENNNMSMVYTSLLVYAVGLVFGTTLALFFSYYIYKKYLFHGIFKVFLFLPQILSSVVLSLLFMYLVSDGYIALGGKENLFMADKKTVMIILLFFNVWISFGANILIYSGAMSGINESVVESAHLEGVNPLQEFWYITFPMIFPTFITFLVAGLVGIFSSQFNLYTIYADAAPIRTVGYYLYVQSVSSALVPEINSSSLTSYLSYSEISAFGLIIAIIIVPITLLIKKILIKFGPNAN